MSVMFSIILQFNSIRKKDIFMFILFKYQTFFATTFLFYVLIIYKYKWSEMERKKLSGCRVFQIYKFILILWFSLNREQVRENYYIE